MKFRACIAVTFTVFFAGYPVCAEPPSIADIKKLTEDYFAKRHSEGLRTDLTLEEARQAQKEFVAQLSSRLGKRVGYKVGLTSKAVQESMGVTSPIRGVLLADMMLKDDAIVSSRFGARPIYEPDLVVVVKDDGINHAKTPLEVAQHLTEIVAFIELPDRIVAESVKVNGNLLTALNGSARLGILGERAKIQPTETFLKALAEMTVTATDQNGIELAKAKGSALLGHPLNAVLWLIEDLAATGEKLQAGDLVSLGSFAAPKPPQPGQIVTVRYEGLPEGPLKASVRISK